MDPLPSVCGAILALIEAFISTTLTGTNGVGLGCSEEKANV